MEKVTLKRGRRTVTLEKSEDLIAVRPTSQAEVGEVLASVASDTAPVETGTTLGGFQIIKLSSTKEKLEETLDVLRQHHLVDAGSHVYHTPGSTAPVVPTGKIALRFTPDSTEEQRQHVIDENHLEVIDSEIKQKPDGTRVEAYTVRTTPEAPNPLKVAEKLQTTAADVVALAEPDLAIPGQLFTFQLPTDPLLKEQWHLRNTGMQFGTSLGLKAGADARVVGAWQRMQSLGSPACVVAIIDDGFDLTHPDLSGNSKVVAPFDFTTRTTDPRPRRFNPDSRQGDYHGTACAGVAIGNPSGGGIIGAAPNCRFMPVRWTASISDDTIKEQFAYVTAQGAWVVSGSWRVASDNFPLSTEMEEAITACATQGRGGLGCVIVFAAGNSNHDINDPPNTVDGFAIHPDVIAVAASNSRDEKSDYSNFGREISICAPSSGGGGRRVLTSDVRGTFQLNGSTFDAGYEAGDYTRSFGGTSSSTPLVAGICALVLSVNPGLTARQVRRILERTARRVGDPASYDANGHSNLFGHGCVDADAAVKAALASVAPAGDPGLALGPGPHAGPAL